MFPPHPLAFTVSAEVRSPGGALPGAGSNSVLWCLWSGAFPTLAQLSAHLSNTAGFLNEVSSMECMLEPGSLREEVVGPWDGDEAATGQSVAAEHWPLAPLAPGC